MASSAGEKVLVIELITTQLVITFRQVANGNIPKPQQYLGSMFVFLVLGGASAISPNLARFSAAFGGLVLLATLVNAQSQDQTISKVLPVVTGQFKTVVTA